MKSTGRVFAEKPSISVEPTRLPDRSRFGSHCVYTDIVDKQLPSGLWVRTLNGSTSKLKNSTSDWRIGDLQGTVVIWFHATVVDVYQTLFASSDETDGTYKFQFMLYDDNYLTMDIRSGIPGTIRSVRGGTLITADAWNMVALISNGSAWRINLNGVEETITVRTTSNDGVWFGDINNRVNFVVGAFEQAG